MRTVVFGRSAVWNNLSAFVTMVACSAGCGGGPGPEGLQDSVDTTPSGALPGGSLVRATAPTASGGACALPGDTGEGCPCGQEGATASCPGPKVHTGDYTSCAPGERVCAKGAWGACVGKSVYLSGGSVTQDYVSPCGAGSGVHWGPLTLGGVGAGSSGVIVSVQTAATAALLDTAGALHLEAAHTAAGASWTSTAVDAVLAAGGQSSQRWLRVTVDTLPGAPAATIVEWRQASTCGQDSE